MCEAMLRFTAPRLDAVVDAKGGKRKSELMCSVPVGLRYSLGPLHGSLRLRPAAHVRGEIVRTDWISMYENAVHENRQRPESRKTVSCKGKITMSQYINSKNACRYGYGANEFD